MFPLLLLILLAGLTDGVSQTCRLEQLGFASASSKFTDCLGKNTKPVTICVACAEQFQAVNLTYLNILENANCSHELFSSDNAMIIERLMDAYSNLWNKALCPSCATIDSNTTSNFQDKHNLTLSCFSTARDVCADCKTDYYDLQGLFKEYTNEGYACADLADAMNSTSKTWSVTKGCGHTPFQYSPVITMTIGISSLPVLFYLLLMKFC